MHIEKNHPSIIDFISLLKDFLLSKPNLQSSNDDCIEEQRFSTGSLIFMVHYHHLLANWPSLWYTTIFYLPTGHPYGTPSIVYWHTGYQYGTKPSSTDVLAVPFVHYCLLLAKWPSLWYTPIFYWPTVSPCGTLPSSTGPLALPMWRYYLLLAQLPSPMVHYYLFLLALWYTTISYLPIGCLYGTLLSSSGPLALPIVHNYLLLAHWPTHVSVVQLLSSTGPLTISVVHNHIFLAHWLSLIHYYLLLATGYLYGTLPCSSGPLAVSVVHYYLLFANWPSLC